VVEPLHPPGCCSDDEGYAQAGKFCIHTSGPGHPEGYSSPPYLSSFFGAAAARHHFQTLDFLAHSFVEDGAGQEDQSVRAGVRVVILIDFAWAEYARLFGVHSAFSVFVGRSPGAR
jgi:hypothetical protein